jgi:hypothetical protein
MIWLGFLFILIPLDARAQDWAEHLFQPSDSEWVYVVGLGAGSSEYFALREARRHAIATLIESHLSQSAKIGVLSREGVQGVEVSERVLSGVYEVDLTLLEKIDQRVAVREGVPGYIRQEQFGIKALYRFPKASLPDARLKANTGTEVKDAVLALEARLTEARSHEAELTRIRSDSERLRELMFPTLGLDFGPYGLKVRKYGIFGFGMGVPFRLRLISDRLQVRPFAIFGVGGSNTVDTTGEPDNAIKGYESGASFGADLRFYLSQRIESGWFITFQTAFDRINPTCPKRNTGECVGESASAFLQQSRSVGLGWVIPSERPMTLELLYGVPDHRVGIGLQINFSLIK